jgi:6-phospho-beta-glucosidase
VAIGFQRRFADMLGVDHANVSLEHVGLNHLTWERAVRLTTPGGVTDVLPELLERHVAELAEEVELPNALLRLQGAVPSYYLRYYYAHDEVFREQQGHPSRAEEVMEIERALLQKYADPTVDTKPIELTERGGAFYSEAAVDLIASLRTDRRDAQVVNIRNDGLLPFLPDDHVIEVSATIGVDGFTAVPINPLPNEMSGLIAHVAAYERLALDAAVHGGYDRVVRAMLAHPLVGQFDKAQKLTDRLLAENSAYLTWAR